MRKRGPRRCGICRQPGHTRASCPGVEHNGFPSTIHGPAASDERRRRHRAGGGWASEGMWGRGSTAWGGFPRESSPLPGEGEQVSGSDAGDREDDSDGYSQVAQDWDASQSSQDGENDWSSDSESSVVGVSRGAMFYGSDEESSVDDGCGHRACAEFSTAGASRKRKHANGESFLSGKDRGRQEEDEEMRIALARSIQMRHKNDWMEEQKGRSGMGLQSAQPRTCARRDSDPCPNCESCNLELFPGNEAFCPSCECHLCVLQLLRSIVFFSSVWESVSPTPHPPPLITQTDTLTRTHETSPHNTLNQAKLISTLTWPHPDGLLYTQTSRPRPEVSPSRSSSALCRADVTFGV